MKRMTTILCSLAFMMSGIMLAITASDPSPGTGYKSVAAATLPYNRAFTPGTDVLLQNMPQDLLLDLAKKKGLDITAEPTVIVDTVQVDSLKKRIAELEQKGQVTKVKWRKVPVPAPVIDINVTSSHRTDTIQVPVYYLATQVGNKEGPTGECISIYELQKVDEICPDTTNSSGKGAIEYHVKGDD